MVRSLWTGAAGMKAQQTSVDTIANNLANVNTVGFKSQSVQFKSLLYQTIQTKTTSANGDQKPTTAQVGLGTRVASLNSSFTQGQQTASDSETALCINGDGFFAVKGADGETYYTRNGNFTWALDKNNNTILTTAEGYEVLDYTGKVIQVPSGYAASSISVGSDGAVAFKDTDGTYKESGQTIALYQFRNPNGLDHEGNSLYAETTASGTAMREDNTTGITKSTIAQGYLEGSNVSVADEMVNLIVAQRAYEMNSKSITTSDTMLEEANNLKR